MRRGQDARGHRRRVHDQALVPRAVQLVRVGRAVVQPVHHVDGHPARAHHQVHGRLEGGAPQGRVRARGHVQHAHAQREARGRHEARAEGPREPRVGAAADGRGARRPRRDLPHVHDEDQVALQARPHGDARARGREDRRPQLPHRAQALRGQLARPAGARLHRQGAVRRGVVPHDRRVLQRVPAQGRHGAAAAVRDEPEQVPRVRVPDAIPRGARRQGHRLLRQRLRAQEVRDQARPALHLRADVAGGAAARARAVQDGHQVQHHLHLQGGRHLDRPARRQRHHPDLVALRRASAGGAASRPHPAAQDAPRRDVRLQRLLLHARVARHAGGLLLDQAAAVPRRPGLRVQGHPGADRHGRRGRRGRGSPLLLVAGRPAPAIG
mmetsp:Transcript_46673/g.111841  ORF Transcript_46673/g.111841 Transcript_46673/m.111841 type:complete len:382 (+) Transcript_46673:352-1497(+)